MTEQECTKLRRGDIVRHQDGSIYILLRRRADRHRSWHIAVVYEAIEAFREKVGYTEDSVHFVEVMGEGAPVTPLDSS